MTHPQSSGRPFFAKSVASNRIAALEAKKSKQKGAAKGFGKAPETPAPVSKPSDEPISTTTASESSTQQDAPIPSFLQSVETGGSSSIPTMDQSIPAEERAKKLLRDQYGLRTLEEQRMEDNIVEQRQKIEKLKQKAETGEDFDIMAMLPAPLLKGIDTFLKLGVFVCTVLFVTAGIGITAEAWSKTSGNPLPDNIDTFIVDVVEPNFTPGLLVLLGFSVSLGGFAALQLGSASSQYKEE